MHNAFIEATEGLRVGLGAGIDFSSNFFDSLFFDTYFLAILLNYLLQGLFHAARKVRTVYWKVYNNLYIGSQDALVAAYPTIPDEGKNTYYQAELNCFI